MCEHPAHQVNVSRIGVLCAPDSGKLTLSTSDRVSEQRVWCEAWGGGRESLRLYGGVRLHYWKIDPSAD